MGSAINSNQGQMEVDVVVHATSEQVKILIEKINLTVRTLATMPEVKTEGTAPSFIWRITFSLFLSSDLSAETIVDWIMALEIPEPRTVNFGVLPSRTLH